MNFINRVGRRTKFFVTSTAVAHTVLAVNPTPSLATAAPSLPRTAGSVTVARTAPVNVVTTVNPTPSVAVAAQPLPRRQGRATLGTHTFQPNVILTVNPTRSIVTAARPLPLLPARSVVVDTDDHATSLVSQTAPPAVTVQARRHRYAGTARTTHTGVQTGATSLPPSPAVIGAAPASPRPLPRRAGQTIATQALLPPPAATVAPKIDVIPAAYIRPTAAPRATYAHTWGDDLMARPHPPRVTRAGLTRLAALVGWTSTPKPPEVTRAPHAQPPIIVQPTPGRPPVGTHATRRTPLVSGTLGLSPTAAVTVKARTTAPRPLHPAVASASHVAQTPATRAVSVTPSRRATKAAIATTGRTATPPAPPTRPSVSVTARPLPKIKGGSAKAVSAPLVTNSPKPVVATVRAGKIPVIAKANTLRVAAATIQPPRPKPAAVAPKVLATPPGRSRKTAIPAGPQPVPVAKVVRKGTAIPLAAKRGLSFATPTIHEIPPTRAILAPSRPTPILPGRSAIDRTWPSSPSRHDPMPRPTIVAAGRYPLPRAGRTSFTSNPISWTVAGLPLDLPAAAIQWLRQYPGITAAFGEVLPGTPKLFGDWNLANTKMPYLVYQEIAEGNYGFQSIDAWGQTLAFPQGQFQISIFSTEKRAGRVLAEQVAAALNDAPLTFGDGVLLEMRLQSIHAIPEGAIGTNGSASAYHFALVFLYCVQRNLTFTT